MCDIVVFFFYPGLDVDRWRLAGVRAVAEVAMQAARVGVGIYSRAQGGARRDADI
jgi:hypothetical protein